MAEVEFDAVTKTFPGGVVAVDDLSLSVGDGEFIVLVGPSGCGKSTTLRMLAGLDEVNAGTLRIGGRAVNQLPPKDRDIAMVFQSYALYPHMTVRKNLGFGLKMRRTPRAEIVKRVESTAAMLGLSELLERKPAALSGGQRQRVALGRAIVREPAAFLLDEPLSNLDAKLRVETRAELKQLHRRLGTTTIYVTHDQEEAMTLGQRVVVMAEGRIQQCDAPLQVYNQPVNRFVAGFLGTPPMNFLAARLTDDGEFAQLEEGDLRLPLTDRQRQQTSNHRGAEVVLGIRPENLRFAESTGDSTSKLSCRLEVAEPLGSQTDLVLSLSPSQRLVARTGPVAVAEGSNVTIAIEMDRCHLFEPGEFGRTLTLDP